MNEAVGMSLAYEIRIIDNKLQQTKSYIIPMINQNILKEENVIARKTTPFPKYSRQFYAANSMFSRPKPCLTKIQLSLYYTRRIRLGEWVVV